jgi:hypothetical protein
MALLVQELGNVTPYIVCPGGGWTRADLLHHAMHLAQVYVSAYCIAALLHYCIAVLHVHYCITALLHYCSRHASRAGMCVRLLHYCIAALYLACACSESVLRALRSI